MAMAEIYALLEAIFVWAGTFDTLETLEVTWLLDAIWNAEERDGHDKILSLIHSGSVLSELANILMGTGTTGVELGAVLTTPRPRARQFNVTRLRDQFFETASRFQYVSVPATAYVFDTVISEMAEDTRETTLEKLAECCTSESAFDALYNVVLSLSCT
ncbi:unnamed protein product [Prorocentrum cordatum]|uniref:Uncharacterized protein n=1 Tax=Prorocentrum cordatum TaxID=2364126 RepID=A0ABN9RUF6_9DINO|nr:unnamed protein product [Polarella glacialis]